MYCVKESISNEYQKQIELNNHNFLLNNYENWMK